MAQALYHLTLLAAALIVFGFLLVMMDFFHFVHIWTGGQTPTASDIGSWAYLWELYCDPRTYLTH